MSKTLQVVEPFLNLTVGDHFELEENQYKYSTKETFSSADVEGDDMTSEFSTQLVISIPYAEFLVKEGFLKEEFPEPKFVNIFDEINTLLERYTKELAEVWSDETLPMCMKVEKETVLQNMIKLLDHLKNLKK